ncbi:MAG: glutamate--tRNA ligase [Phycisphaerae bacterium]|nr:glutamate--tRNA ligase [Phycisphaerae bacterium]
MNEKSPVRVRFAPSPTGHLHIGSVRTALFNWLVARQSGGVFILRIEDTDVDRNVPGADRQIMEDMRWLGLQWDEGIDVGGAHGPYYQMQRLDRYNAAVRKLLDAGQAYYAFDTPEELDALRKQAEARKLAFRYPRPMRFATGEEAEQARRAGRPVVVRFKTFDEDITVHDEVMGDVTVGAAELDDFIILKADGIPTYHMANVVDDFDMRTTLVIRGQEFLAQTPRHIALQRALGYPTPRYAHVPTILDMKGRKLSKRDGDVELSSFRKAGYLPETLLNFVALLGWSPGGDREKFTLAELVKAFSIDRISRVNSKFDREKLLAFNTDAIAAADPKRLMEALSDWLSVNPESPLSKAGLDEPTRRVILEINRGFRTFSDIQRKCGFIYQDDAAISHDPAAVKKVLAKDDAAGYKMLQLLLPRLEGLEPWTAASLEALIKAVCEEQSAGMGQVAQPIRVAVSGTTVSPAIYDTLILLGKIKTVRRIRRVLAERP